MIINSIIQVNIGYIPGYNCSKDRKTHHPLCRWCVFLSGGIIGGVAHEQVAPDGADNEAEMESGYQEGTLILFLTSWQASGTTCLYHPHHIGKGIEDFNK